MNFLSNYIIVALILISADLTISVLSLRQKKKKGLYMWHVGLFTTLATIFYFLSTVITDYFTVSLFSSFYFICVYNIMYYLFLSTLSQLKLSRKKGYRILKHCFIAIGLFDLVIFLINPFKEIAVSYTVREGATWFVKYQYAFMPLYYCHLVYTYVLLAISLVMMFIKACHIPKEYKPMYAIPIAGTLLAIILDSVFLFSKGTGSFSFLDYSLILYPILYAMYYYGGFYYSRHGMVSIFKDNIFYNSDVAYYAFDNENLLVYMNEKAHSILPALSIDNESHISDFLKICNVEKDFNINNPKYSFQIYLDMGLDRPSPYRCDYKQLISNTNKTIGRIFRLTNVVDESDVLTGFETLDNFRKFASENKDVFEKCSLGIIDINGLGLINSTLGYLEGDRLIKQLSDDLKQEFPNDTYFVRGNEASLIVICFDESEKFIRKIFHKIALQFEAYLQYCTVEISTSMNVIDAVSEASRGMRVKKLLDLSSTHSATINSLVKALEECDADTEAHVKRTQKMGELLGEKLNLSYLEQSKLSLLCLLHDIGKIGIPLEILNKPSKLTNEEYELMKTHATKGYEIAKSSDELSCIAEMIKHHHERWDGNGYPDGIKGEAIPVLSRIISIIDAYDAMVSDRIYRKGMPKDKALLEIRNCEGTQFDPYISEIFIKMIEENENITIGEMEAKKERNKKKIDIPSTNFNKVHNINFTKYIIGADGSIEECDENFEKLTGYSREYAINNRLKQSDLIPPSDRDEYNIHVSEELLKRTNIFFEHRLLRKDGSITYVICYGRFYYDSVTHLPKSEIIVVECLKNMNSFERMTDIDSLTGLLTIDSFFDKVDSAINEKGGRAAVIAIDIDGLTKYNDTYGYEKGNEYIRSLASKLTAFVPKNGYISRISGGKFALALMFDKEEKEDIRKSCESVIDALKLSTAYDMNNINITCGFAILKNDEDKARNILTRAFMNLKSYKELQ